MHLLRRLSGQPYLLLSLTAAMWAGNAVAGKLAVGHISPFMLTGLRWFFAVLVLLPLAAPALRRDWPVIRRHWVFLTLLSAIGFTLFNTLFYIAVHYTTALNAAIEQAAMPLFVFAMNFLLFRIRTAWLQFGGYALTLAGVILTATHGNPLQIAEQPINIGDVLMLVAASMYGLYSVLLVRKPPLHWLSLIAVLAVAALVTSLPGVVWEIASGNVLWPDGLGWSIAVFTAVFPSILAQVMWIQGLGIIGSNRGGVFINLVPVFAAAMAVTILGEVFHPYHAVAMALVILGVWLAQRASAKAA